MFITKNLMASIFVKNLREKKLILNTNLVVKFKIPKELFQEKSFKNFVSMEKMLIIKFSFMKIV